MSDNQLIKYRDILIKTAQVFEDMVNIKARLQSKDSESERASYEKTVIDNYQNSISLNRLAKDLLREIKNEEEIRKNYGNIAYDMCVSQVDNAIIIKLDGLMLHRKVAASNKAQWESELMNMLSDFTREKELSPVKEAVIVYQHIFPYDLDESKIYDNDNYQQRECKMILDAIVTAGLIKKDKGTDCHIMHMASLGSKYETKVHVVNKADFGIYYSKI